MSLIGIHDRLILCRFKNWSQDGSPYVYVTADPNGYKPGAEKPYGPNIAFKSPEELMNNLPMGNNGSNP